MATKQTGTNHFESIETTGSACECWIVGTSDREKGKTVLIKHLKENERTTADCVGGRKKPVGIDNVYTSERVAKRDRERRNGKKIIACHFYS
jgi:hypothetical protein